MISTERLTLRVLSEDDAAPVMEYLRRNREHFSRAGALVNDDYFTVGYQRARLRRESELAREGTMLRLFCFLRSEPEAGPIGDISLSQIFRGIMMSCYLGYKIDRDRQGRGLMTEGVRAALGVAFDDLGLHRVEANIMPSNVASQRLVEKLGFVREGYSSKYLKINGVWEDHLRYAIISPREV